MSGGVPELHAEDAIVQGHIFGHEINPNGCLGKCAGTSTFSSKVSCINLERIEVLPVDWSPRKTTLILDRT